MKAPTLICLAACLLGGALSAQGAPRRPAPTEEPGPRAALEKAMQRFDHLEATLKRVTEALKRTEQARMAQDKRLSGLEQALRARTQQAPQPRPQVFLQTPPRPQAGAEAAPPIQRRVLIQQPRPEAGPPRASIPGAEVRQQAMQLRQRLQAQSPPRVQARIEANIPQRPAPQGQRGLHAHPEQGAQAGSELARRVAGRLKDLPPAGRLAFFAEMAKLRAAQFQEQIRERVEQRRMRPEPIPGRGPGSTLGRPERPGPRRGGSRI